MTCMLLWPICTRYGKHKFESHGTGCMNDFFIFKNAPRSHFEFRNVPPGVYGTEKHGQSLRRTLKKIHLSEKTRETDPRCICKKKQGSTLIIREPYHLQVRGLRNTPGQVGSQVRVSRKLRSGPGLRSCGT